MEHPTCKSSYSPILIHLSHVHPGNPSTYASSSTCVQSEMSDMLSRIPTYLTIPNLLVKLEIDKYGSSAIDLMCKPQATYKLSLYYILFLHVYEYTVTLNVPIHITLATTKKNGILPIPSSRHKRQTSSTNSWKFTEKKESVWKVIFSFQLRLSG